jgi:hypothetical protein
VCRLKSSTGGGSRIARIGAAGRTCRWLFSSLASTSSNPYRERPAGSASKLSTIRDGVRILLTIVALVREERPLCFFGNIFGLLAAASIALACPVFATYFETGLVPRFSTAILATGMMVVAFLSAACGLILDTVTRGRLALKRFHDLAVSLPRRFGEGDRSGMNDS